MPPSRPARAPRRIGRLRRVLLVGALLAALPSYAGARDAGPPVAGERDAGPPVAGERVGSAGAGDPYFPRDGNGGYDVVHYDVRDRLGADDGHLVGRTVLTARALTDLDAFHLDLLLPVRGVRVDGARAAWSRPDAHEVLVRPARPLRAGEVFRVQVDYAGDPGSLRWRGAGGWHARGAEVLALAQPQAAPWWFPASDHPSDKARLDVRVTVPRGRQVVSGGRLVGVRRGPARATWHWRADEPVAPSLAFVAVGRFTVERGRRGGRPWLLAVSRALPARQHDDALRLMRRTPEVVSWLERRLGLYPFSTSGGLTTSLPLGFALETQTRPVFPAVGPDAVGLVVHEQAHQWFGASVSLRGWADIWLNEGFATFLEHHWAESRGGPDLGAWLRRWHAALAPDPDFWSLPIGDPGPHHLFDWEVYQRGAMAVQALRERVGEEAFWRLLRRWLAERRGGHGSVAEFRALAAEVTGADLEAFFDAWLLDDTAPPGTEAFGLGTPR